MDHGSDLRRITPAFPREQGILVCIDCLGAELRAHSDGRGHYHFHRWYEHPWLCWIGPVAYGLTAEEIRACAKALTP